MTYAFFGTPRFAEIILKKLIAAKIPPALVVCNPDRPVGRKKIVTLPPTKILAEKHGISVYQPEKLDPKEFEECLSAEASARPAGRSAQAEKSKIGNIDFAIVSAYGKIIPGKILKMAKHGFIGVHPSLLSRYRGPTPIQSVLLDGKTKTGITIYLVDVKLDHGPVIARKRIEITDTETYESLHDKLAEIGADLLIKTLPKYLAGEIEPKFQRHSRSTPTKKFSTNDAFVPYEDLLSAFAGNKEKSRTIERMIRALNPEPGVWTVVGELSLPNLPHGKRVKLLETEIRGGNLVLKKIQVEGKNPKTV